MIDAMGQPKEKLPLDLVFLPTLAKGFSVFYFVLLPILFAENLITAQELGYIGAAFIAAAILGAVAIIRWLHALRSKRLLQLSSWLAIAATLLLLLAVNEAALPLLVAAYVAMGLASGTSIAAINALTANNTIAGKRYGSLALQSMVTDVVRIASPILVAGALAVGKVNAAIGLILIANLAFLWLALKTGDMQDGSDVSPDDTVKATSWKHNKAFRFVLGLEFLDSFSSSQLFVFVPLLFLAKGYSLQNALVLQSSIFLGYIVGRWLIARIAKEYSGIAGVAVAEAGMVLAILLLLVVNNLALLYLLSFALGAFTRGTSPTIRALSLDVLEGHQIKQGAAVHAVAGDSGSVIAQLVFGMLVAWTSVQAPFVAAMFVGLIVLFLCITQRRALTRLV